MRDPVILFLLAIPFLLVTGIATSEYGILAGVGVIGIGVVVFAWGFHSIERGHGEVRDEW